uniref:Coenzyme Q7 homolog, ubiquinone (yeast) n=1 Tax=Sinocyclocheilus anshuiensis TaxID=1608454 RepID=A0A671T8B1_9TELE
MQRAAKCALRRDLSRAFCPSSVRNCRAVKRVNSSVLCRRYSILPPPRDEEEKAMLDSMLRVDHAGEYGANRIYAGQMAVLGMILTRIAWACTALLGKEGAMACIVAVEDSISEHYNSQIRILMEADPERYTELLQLIKEFRDDEIEHHDTGLEHDAESVPGYLILKTVIQVGCKAAIYISQRI